MSERFNGEGPKTVAEFVELLSKFPPEWRVEVATRGGGGIAIEHRETGAGRPFVAIFGSNGGRFGEEPLTEDEYKKQSVLFLSAVRGGQAYTSVHGDHRTYRPSFGSQASCYGSHYDRRVIERMVREGLINANSVDIETVAYIDRYK